MDYPNVPLLIGSALSAGISQTELDTTLSVEDVYDALEVKAVNAHNQRTLAERAAKRA